MVSSSNGGGASGGTSGSGKNNNPHKDESEKAAKTVTTIDLCRSTFSKFIIVTPVVSIDRDCDGAGALDTVVMEEPNGLGTSRTIAVVRDVDENGNEEFYKYRGDTRSWNQWGCSLVYAAINCLGWGGSATAATTAATTTTKLLQPCQYRRAWYRQRQHQQQQQHP